MKLTLELELRGCIEVEVPDNFNFNHDMLDQVSDYIDWQDLPNQLEVELVDWDIVDGESSV